jgi:SRSO17 transposase
MDTILGENEDTLQRLEAFIDQAAERLGHPARKAPFVEYVCGLLGGADRKNMERICAEVSPELVRGTAAYQRLHHFISESAWSDRELRRYATRYAVDAMEAHANVQAWIIDDTGIPKQGNHSVGVQRQYSGTLGKVDNCQVAVSLTLATEHHHAPVDFELYLPTSWTENPARRAQTKIPDSVSFKTKPQLALEMLRRAVEDDLPRGTVLADEAYGNDSAFRLGVRSLGLHYAVAVGAKTKIWKVDKLGRRCGEPVAVAEFAKAHMNDRSFRRYTWREGTAGPLSARFAFQRVVPFHDDGNDASSRERVWLICEWRDGDSEPAHFYFVSERPTKRKAVIRLLKERWRTERAYQDLKQEVGFDHFEGRGLRGWNHHASLALLCCAFLTAERARRFSPLRRQSLAQRANTLRIAA